MQAQAAAFFAETLPADAPQPDLPALFTAYDQFAKRCRKLGDMFATVHQFSQLGAHSHIEGIDAIMAKFSVVGDGWVLQFFFASLLCGEWDGRVGLSCIGCQPERPVELLGTLHPLPAPCPPAGAGRHQEEALRPAGRHPQRV